MSADSGSNEHANPGAAEGRPEQRRDTPVSRETPGNEGARPRLEHCNVLILSFLAFVLIVFGVWVVSAGHRYREEYAQAKEGFRLGSTRSVELILGRDDQRNLACASDQTIAGLRCAYRRDLLDAPSPDDDSQILQPYNTVGSELLLGAGLWSSSELKDPSLPSRFTAVCNYHVQGFAKTVSVRFAPTGYFGPVGKTTPIGTLTECVVPR